MKEWKIRWPHKNILSRIWNSIMNVFWKLHYHEVCENQFSKNAFIIIGDLFVAILWHLKYAFLLPMPSPQNRALNIKYKHFQHSNTASPYNSMWLMLFWSKITFILVWTSNENVIFKAAAPIDAHYWHEISKVNDWWMIYWP